MTCGAYIPDMDGGGRVERRRALVLVAAAGLLCGCGTASGSGAGLQGALVVELPGFVLGADSPLDPTVCDPEPSAPNVLPPALPADMGAPTKVFFQKASTTVEAYAWRMSDPPLTARDAVGQTQATMAPCDWTLTTAHDLDGDGELETPASETQEVEDWTVSRWTGTRVHRVVPGYEQVDRRLVYADDVVLQVVVRADSDDPADVAVADDYLEAVAANLG